MMWSSHPRLEGEMPGKASNVDWAARAACSHLRAVGARPPPCQAPAGGACIVGVVKQGRVYDRV